MDRESIETKPIINLTQSTAKTFLHPEDEGLAKINDFIFNTKTDLTLLDSNLMELGSSVNTLLTNTMDRLNTAKDKLILEKERLQDIIMLCNKYTDFEKTIKLTNIDFDGNFQYDNGMFTCPISSTSSVRYKIRDILGNGFEGNKYVYNQYDSTFVEETVNTAKRENIYDSSKASYWEYSRITSSESEKYSFPEINFDSEEAKVTLDIETESNVSQLYISSNDDNIVLSDIVISNNGKDYEDLNLKNITINSKEESYDNYNYTYGSGLIAFKPCDFIKLTLESKGHNNDTIAFKHKTLLEDGGISKETVTILPTAKRSVVSINDLEIKKVSFASSTSFVSKELITDSSVSVISLFCNVFLPKPLTDSAVRFILTVNGEDIEIAPINSHLNKTKIVRFSNGTMKNDYTHYLNEKIKSAKLKVILTGKAEIAPYVNNIKILIGDTE